MFDTYITVVGNVLTAPEWRRTKNTGVLVANFRIASTARRFDKVHEAWADGDSFRVRVNCWRRLAEGVTASVMVGDPVIVFGRMVTREWKTETGESRVGYELEALAVGHDLSRGRARFERRRPATSTTTIEDAEFDARVAGELSEPVEELNRPAGQDGLDDFDFDLPELASPMALADQDLEDGSDSEPDQDSEAGEDEPEQGDGTSRPGRRGRRRNREAVLA